MPLNPESFTTADTGYLLVDKPQEWTSHDVVNCIRGRFRLKKVGHCGTLDPLATGVLVIVTGKATKVSSYLTADSKVYQATLTLGADTDSHDSEGQITEEFDWSHVTEEQVCEVIESFHGEQDQIPPMVSAIKKGGKKLYDLARKGIEVEREPRRINIPTITVDSIDLPNITFTAECSKGTYIRVLCYDIAKKLKTGGHMTALRRTKSGRFNIEDAHTMDEIKSWEQEKIYSELTPVLDIVHEINAAEADA